MRKNPTTLAWVVLLLSFFACVVLVILVPSGIKEYVSRATRVETVDLQVIKGTVLYRQSGDRAEVGVLDGQVLQEGDTVRTTDDSKAFVKLFEGSNVQLWPNSRLVVQTVRTSRFTSQANQQSTVVLLLSEGHCRVEVALPPTESRRLEIVTPNAHVVLQEGSYSIETSQASGKVSTLVITHNGSASVEAAGKTVDVLRAERTQVEADQVPAAPTPAKRDLLVNGDFSQGLEVGWMDDSRAEDGVLPTIRLGTEDGRVLAHFERSGSSKHGEALLVQKIDSDVTDLDSLTLNLEVKLLKQSLSGGGWMGSEYPLMVRLQYRDANGHEATWVRGFYYQNDDNHPITNGVQVPVNTWYQLAKPVNLFDPQQVNPRPAYISSIELVASGWDFDSQVTNVSLMAE